MGRKTDTARFRHISGPVLRQLIWALSAASLLACGGGTPPPEPPPASPLPETEPQELEESRVEPQESPSAAPSSEDTPPAVDPGPDPAEICERLCQRVERTCKPQAVQGCRASCRDYVQAWEQCPVEVEEALTCQTEAKDAMVCTNLAAASCVAEFTELADCREGRAEPKLRREASSPEAGEQLPPGWQRHEDAELGISVPLPEGVTESSTDAGKRLAATEAGIEYLVESPPRLKGQATDKALLKAVVDYLGPACQKSLKVHGRFETGDVVHVHFDTGCKDGTYWRGMLHVGPRRMVTTSARSSQPLSSQEVSDRLEALLYKFRFLGP